MERTDSNHSAVIKRNVSFFEAFLQQESALFQREIGGVPYYHFIRFHFYHLILERLGWIEKPDRREFSSCGRLIRIFFSILRRGYAFGKHVWTTDNNISEILALSGTKRIVRNGIRIDPYVDPFLRSTSRSFVVWESPTLWQHPPNDGDAHLFYLDRILYAALLNRTFIRRGRKRIRQEAKYLCRWARRFDVELEERRIFGMIHTVLSMYNVAERRITECLRAKEVRLILAVNHYEPLKMLIILIARRMGIPVVELQHGNMGRYHIAYNLGFEEAMQTLPDEIFTFGSFWNRTTRIERNGVIMTAVGMPFFEERMRRVHREKPSHKTRILFLSQETIGRWMGGIAFETARRADPDRVEIWYKLHPREYDLWKKIYPESFLTSGIRVFSDADLDDLMAQADVHVGVYSTTVIESLVFGKVLIILEAYGAHYFTDLLETGRAHFAADAGDILDIVDGIETQPMGEQEISRFWCSDSLKKMHRRIDELLA